MVKNSLYSCWLLYGHDGLVRWILTRSTIAKQQTDQSGCVVVARGTLLLVKLTALVCS